MNSLVEEFNFLPNKDFSKDHKSIVQVLVEVSVKYPKSVEVD